MTDLDLARRVAAGEDPACRAFFDEYLPRLYRFARLRLGGDDLAAEEVVQSTLIRAVRKLGSYRGEAALFSWLCTLCRHEVGAWLERTGRRSEVQLAEDQPAVIAALEVAASLADRDPEGTAVRRETSRLVHATLDQLPANYGAVLEWRYIEGFTVEEVAGRLGVGYKAAESILARARAAFRDAFAVVAGDWRGVAIGEPGTAREDV